MRKLRWWMPVLLAALCVAAYGNTFHVPFIFDDIAGILRNPAIRRLWPMLGVTVTNLPALLGRPLVSLSLAINYALGGYNVVGYHVFNLAVHFFNALLVFGIARHALANAPTADVSREETTWLAYTVAVLWMLHPLLTESVTYVLQRTELLAAFFLLSTLYGFIRGTESADRTVWFGLAVMACILGAGAKEIMVVTPFLVLAYDYTFVASSIGKALRDRSALYAGLAASWIVVAALQFTTNLGWKTGVSVSPLGCWDYLTMQCGVIVHYLRLAVWPCGLVLDYSDWPRTSPLIVLSPKAGMLLALLAASTWGIRRRRWWGFWGAWFFLLLAPSSSFLPLPTEPAAERRMYLPLVAIIAVALGAGWRFCRSRAPVWLQASVVTGLALVLGVAAIQRNAQYHSAASIWADVVAKRPGSVRGHTNLGLALLDEGKAAESIPHFMDALRLDPNEPIVHCDLGSALVANGAVKEGIAQYEEALHLDPNFEPARAALGNVLANQSNVRAALQQYQAALAINPNDEAAHFNLAQLLAPMGRREEAISHYLEVVRLDPRDANVHYNLANLLAEVGREREAISHYSAAAGLAPGDARSRINLGNLFLKQAKWDDAIATYTEALRTNPNAFEAHNNMAVALANRGDLFHAAEHFGEAARLNPNLPEVHSALAEVLERLGRHQEAQQQLAEARRLTEIAGPH